MAKEKIKPLTLEIDPDLWNEFKIRIPRTIKLNDALVRLIEREMRNKK